jgi:hypothetical protein
MERICGKVDQPLCPKDGGALTTATPKPWCMQPVRLRGLHCCIPLQMDERYFILVEKPLAQIEIIVDPHKAAAGRQAKHLDDRSHTTD